MSIFKDHFPRIGSSGASTGYTIDQSIRFNYGDSPYMYRSPSSTGNRKKFTNSFWYKRGAKIGDYQALPSVHTTESGGSYGMYLSTANVLQVFTYYTGSAWQGLHYSNRVFRDVSAWYHFVWTVDTTHPTASERVRIYINGVRETSWSSESYPSQNQDLSFNNSGEQHNVGKDANGSYYVDGYGAEMHYIDGYSYGPEYFGEFDENGIWIPKEYSGSYGTNGFYIEGSNSGSLGTDSSGNGNNLTVSGLQSNDQKTDSPTNNHCTWNPLTGSAQVYTNGNLNAATASSAWKGGLTTMQVPLNSGIWYYEMYIDSAGSSSGQFSIGWSESDRSITDDNSSGDTQGWVTYAINGKTYNNASSTVSYGATYTTGDVIGCKIDTDTSSNNITFYKNGASQGNLSEAFNAGTSGFISPYILLYGTRNGTARFAYNEWTQTPTGITESNAINSINLGAI